jgi:hypothetical protein
MKGLIQVTATKGKKIITAEVFGDILQPAALMGRLLNRNKILHRDRPLWILKETKLNKEIKL